MSNNYCISCGVEIPEGRQVCPFCMDEKQRSHMDLDGLMSMLENGLDVELVKVIVEDESIELTMPPETLLNLLNEDEFMRYYIFSSPIESVKFDGDILIVNL